MGSEVHPRVCGSQHSTASPLCPARNAPLCQGLPPNRPPCPVPSRAHGAARQWAAGSFPSLAATQAEDIGHPAGQQRAEDAPCTGEQTPPRGLKHVDRHVSASPDIGLRVGAPERPCGDPGRCSILLMGEGPGQRAPGSVGCPGPRVLPRHRAPHFMSFWGRRPRGLADEDTGVPVELRKEGKHGVSSGWGGNSLQGKR